MSVSRCLRFIYRQKQEGLIPPNAALDVFSGTVPPTEDDDDYFPSKEDLSIKFGAKSYPECARFFMDGSGLITGSVDGFIEIWDVWTGKLREDLAYQASEKFMMHDSAVLSLNVSKDDDLLVSGGQDGEIKVWRVRSGHCIRKYEAAHSQGITSVSFSTDKSRILSSSFDGTIRIHGIKSGKMLKEMRGHESFVNSAEFSNDEEKVLSSSSDGTIRIWSVDSTESLVVFKLPQLRPGIDQPIINATFLIGAEDQILVCQNGRKAYITSTTGEIQRTYAIRENILGNFLSCTISNHNKFLYALSNGGELMCFDMTLGKIVESLEVLDKGVVGMCQHPTRNLIAVYSRNGLLKILKS